MQYAADAWGWVWGPKAQLMASSQESTVWRISTTKPKGTCSTRKQGEREHRGRGTEISKRGSITLDLRCDREELIGK
jgi:hypothetical protein